MTLRTLFDNISGTPGTGSGGPNFVLGTPFDLSADATITQCGFYRPDAVGNVVPTQFSIYRRGDQAQLVQEFSAEGGTGPGWVYTDLPTPLAVTAGDQLVVAALYPYQASWGRLGSGARPAAPLGITWPTNYRQLVSSPDMVYPTSGDTASMECITIRFDSEAPIADPTTVSAIEISNQLTAWLSAGAANKHTAQLPQLTYNAVDTVEGSLTTLLSRVSANLETTVNAISTSVGSGLGTAVAGFKSGWEAWRGVTDWTWDTAQAVFALEGTLLQGAGALTGKKWVDVVGKIYSWLGSLGRETEPPGTGWAMVAEVDFTGDLAWAQPADLYLLTWSVLPSALATSDVDGVPLTHRLAWWAEWDGTSAGQRSYVDFGTAFLAGTGRRLAGLVLRPYGPCVGHVQAWTYTAP